MQSYNSLSLFFFLPPYALFVPEVPAMTDDDARK